MKLCFLPAGRAAVAGLAFLLAGTGPGRAQTVVFTLPTGTPAEFGGLGAIAESPFLGGCWWAYRAFGNERLRDRHNYFSVERGTLDFQVSSVHLAPDPGTPLPRLREVQRDGTYYYFLSQNVAWRKPVGATDSDPAEAFFDNAAGLNLRALHLHDGWLYLALGAPLGANEGLVLQRRHTITGKNENLVLGNPPGIADLKVRRLVVAPFKRPRITGAAERTGLFLVDESDTLWLVDLEDRATVNRLDVAVKDFVVHTSTVFKRLGGPGDPLTLQDETVVYTRRFNPSLGRESLYRESLDDHDPKPLPILGGAQEPVPTALTADATSLFVAAQGDGNFRLFRYPFPAPFTGTWDLIAADQPKAIDRLATGPRELFFTTGTELRRLPKNAPAIEFVARALGVEVVQAIQNLRHDVPLIVRKPTLVRGYATISRNSLERKDWQPTAVLRGFRAGTELPGSPLVPANVAPVSIGTTEPAPGGNDDPAIAAARRELARSFNFDLPAAWVAAPGEVTFRFVLDPSNTLPESPVGRGHTPAEDNVAEVTVPFGRGAHPTLMFVPLSCAAGPDYRPGQNGYPAGDFDQIIARARALLPVEDLDLRFSSGVVRKKVFSADPLDFGVHDRSFSFGAPAFGPGNLGGELIGEAQWALVYTALHALGSPRVPGADVHWVGAVAPMEAGFNGVGGVPGLHLADTDPPWWLKYTVGFLPLPETPLNTTVVVRMSPANGDPQTNRWNQWRGGFALAHELGHNYGQFHIDQSGRCGGQAPAAPLQSYPYVSGPCTLGSSSVTGPGDFVGYDPVERVLVPPEAAGDLMSYDDSRWISAHTWRAILDRAPRAAGTPGTGRRPDRAHPALNPQPLPPKVLLVAGVLTPDGFGGGLVASQLVDSDTVDPALAAASINAANVPARDFPFRLLQVDEAGRTLAESALQLLTGGEDALGAGGFPFAQIVAPEPGLAGLKLVARDGQVVLDRPASSGGPVLVLGSPAIEPATQSLRLPWTATDPDGDRLTFSAQFSADDGENWTLVDPMFDSPELVLPLATLPGGAKCRLRIAATDGFHSTVAGTGPFALPDHAPAVAIAGLNPGEVLAFGDGRSLRGSALDLEDGQLEAEGLQWRLTGALDATQSGGSFPLLGLPPGLYSLELSATDSAGLAGAAVIHFRVGPLVIPVADPVPDLDGFPNDAAYTRAAVLRVPLSSGGTAFARLIRAGGALWASLVDLPLAPPGQPPVAVGLALNPNAAGDGGAQPGDRGYFVDETGTVTQRAGNGIGLQPAAGSNYGFTAAVSVGERGWNAELRLDENLPGLTGPSTRLLLELRRSPDPGPASDVWPPGAVPDQPATWGAATTAPPLPPANLPPLAAAGPAQFLAPERAETVFLNGTGSVDPEGAPLAFAWQQTGGPAVALIDDGLALAHFVTGPVAAPTSLRFALTVNDGVLASEPAETLVLLAPPPAAPAPAPRLPPPESGPDGTFRGALRITGQAGDRVAVEASTNLLDWERIGVRSLDLLAGLSVTDPDAALFSHRFYRATPAVPDEEPEYPAGLVSLWRGEGDARDTLGNNPGELLGAVTFGPGRYGRAFHFDGRGEGLVRIPDSPSLRPSAFTITAWVRFEEERPFGGLAAGNLIFAKSRRDFPGLPSVSLRAPSVPGILGQISHPGTPGNFVTISQQHYWQANTNTWYHLALTAETNRVALFLNGVPLPAQAPFDPEGPGVGYDDGPASIGGALFAGPNNPYAQAFHGFIDEVACFNRVLGNDEIERLAGFHPLAAAPVPGTILYARADGTLWALSPDGQTNRFVTVGTQPRLSPDRRTLLLRRFDGSPGGIILARDLATGAETPVFPVGSYNLGFSWFPDSRRVAFDDFNLGPSLQGFRSFNYDDGSGPAVLLVRHPYDAVPVVSPDGAHAVFQSFSGNVPAEGGIYAGTIDGEFHLGGVTRFPNTTYGDAWPLWSPDGSRLSFSDRRDLFVMFADGSHRLALTAVPRPADHLASTAPFVPDGSAVIAAGVIDGVRGIYRIPADGSGPPRLLRALPRMEYADTPDDVVGSVAW